MKTADASNFSPIGDTVKNSIEDSDRCEPSETGESDCEVPSFEFLSAESEEDNPLLNKLRNMLSEGDVQLVQCSGNGNVQVWE